MSWRVRWEMFKLRLLRWWEDLPGFVIVWAVIVGAQLGLSGCSNPAMVAVHVADSTAILQEQAAPILRERCIEPIPRLSDAELVEHRKACDPAIGTYTAVRTIHVALRAALVAYAAAVGVSRDDLVATLIRLAAELGVEAATLAAAIEGLK